LATAVGFVSAPTFAQGPTAAAAQTETKQVAGVKVEIRQESGEVVKGSTDLDWNEDGSLTVEQDGTKHKLRLRLDRDGNSKKVSVTLAYVRGGEDIVAPYTFDAKVKKREVVRIEGNLAIAVTVTPKKAAATSDEAEGEGEEKAPKKRKLDMGGDSDDPLAGLD
jgi:hypothetical protein